MLTQLIVKDFALVDHLDLEFRDGMSVISGETGAGKSIILSALGLALGDRADISLIARGAERAEISATFDIGDNDDASAWLQRRDLTDHDGPQCILRRVIGRDGRSRGFINGTPSTVTDMKALGDMLMDIHSQHEHQSLLKRETQRRLLDEFGGLVSQACKVEELYRKFRECKDRLEALVADSAEQSSRLQLLEYQSAELAELGITAGEYTQLEQEQKRLANAETILRNCHQAMAACQEDDAGALRQLSMAIQLLSDADDKAIRATAELLESSRIQIEEAVRDLVRFTDEFEMDPGRLAEVETRLGQIYDISRKHRVEPGEIPALEKRINDELASLADVDNDIEALTEEAGGLEDAYSAAAEELGKGRRKAASALEKSVSDRFSNLGMPGASLKVALSPAGEGAPAPGGLEQVEFLISTNPGQEPRPLNKIASGGELSRISLAIQVVTADTSKVPTLVFDEVDVGIGGGVAEVVGSLLRQLGERAQIVCVTHLPQVAAQGHNHYRVTKASDARQATTHITPLSDGEKVAEIARMLGGLEMTEQSVAHAEEMFRNAQGR